MFKILIEYIKALIAEQWKICIANRIPVAVLALSALTSCAAIASVGGQTRLIAYEEQGGWRVEVFDLRAGRLTSGGREILGPAREQSEFSGPIRPCASPDYYCFVTGLHVAVPRAGSPSSWSADKIRCQVLDAAGLLSDRAVRIRCQASERSAVEFSYSRQRGIISYRRLCTNCFEGEYSLIGPTGLFASSN